MNFGIYSYTATILIFCGSALLLYIIGRLLRKKSAMLPASDWKVIIWTMIIFAVITGFEEHVALTWRIWTYNPERTFSTIFLGAEIETYLFIILVSLVVSIATIVYARREGSIPFELFLKYTANLKFATLCGKFQIKRVRRIENPIRSRVRS